MELSVNTYLSNQPTSQEPEFQVFWEKWCEITRNNKGEFSARAAFNNLLKQGKNKCSLNYLLSKLNQQNEEQKLKSKLGLFTSNWPLAAIWLADERYLDDLLSNFQLKLLAKQKKLMQTIY